MAGGESRGRRTGLLRGATAGLASLCLLRGGGSPPPRLAFPSFSPRSWQTWFSSFENPLQPSPCLARSVPEATDSCPGALTRVLFPPSPPSLPVCAHLLPLASAHSTARNRPYPVTRGHLCFQSPLSMPWGPTWGLGESVLSGGAAGTLTAS